MTDASGFGLGHAVALLAAGVVAVPVFRKLGLGSVLGYLAAGLVIGPFGLGLFADPETLLHVAELGVVLFLFIIGLEMRPTKLWALRWDIFGLGAIQVLTCGALLTGVAMLGGLPLAAAAVGAMGFVLSSTAVIMQVLEEAGDANTPAGQRAISILLLEDLSIVPLLALVALWGALHGNAEPNALPVWQSIMFGIATIIAVVAVGRWLLDPMFRILARAGAREVMTAAALLVALGTALVMEAGGLSMAMGAFLAGVLLSESTFRHQLEADIEPFRGILLGLFFLSVGMSLNLDLVLKQWPLVAAGVLAFMAVKSFGIYVVARLMKSDHAEARQRAALFAQGGEFAFVLYVAAQGVNLLDAETSAMMTAIVILSMALTPLVLLVLKKAVKPPAPLLDGIDKPENLRGRVLFVGFGRFAQVVTQSLLARDVELSLIEIDVDMIRAAANFGFKIHYGDGTRLDVLRASGAASAEAILICVDKPEVADRIVALCKSEFPLAKLFVRAYDRGHVLRLVKAGVDYQIRELFESALVFSKAVLRSLDFEDEVIADVISDVRRRDIERQELELVGGLEAGRTLIRGNMPTPQPTPFTPPRRAGKVIGSEVASETAPTTTAATQN
ncbi:MAG: cation:proton antiporter [Rhodospirillaceae bacterium]|nr:cation:proton antiporter [Rhodospirillaceae bacterium]